MDLGLCDTSADVLLQVTGHVIFTREIKQRCCIAALNALLYKKRFDDQFLFPVEMVPTMLVGR